MESGVNVHQPSTRIESPVAVMMVLGFVTVCQGSWGNAFRLVKLPRSCCLKLFFWLFVVSQIQYTKR